MGAYGVAPSDVRPDKEEPIHWGRMIADMFQFKFVKRNIGTTYTRVWLCEVPLDAESDDTFVKLNEEPVGVTIVRNPAIPINITGGKIDDVYWTKVGSEWISSDENEGVFLRAFPITEAEYGTDLAFELWPELRSTNRPFRAWRKLNNHLLKKWSVLIATLSLGGVSYAASQADGAINNWFIVAMCMGVVAFIACAGFLVTNDYEW